MTCRDGRCVPLQTVTTEMTELASDEFFPTRMTLAGDSLVWAEPVGLNTISRVPIDGGLAVALASPDWSALGLAADATHVYWSSWDINAQQGQIQNLPLDAGAIVPLATIPAQFPTGIAVDRTGVYWVQQPLEGSGRVRVMVSSVDGGPPLEVDHSSTVTVDPSKPVDNSGVAVDATGVYWTNAVDRAIGWIPKDGGPPTILATTGALSSTLAVSSGRVFFVDVAGLHRVDVSSGQQTRLAPSVAPGDTVSADGEYVYFVIAPSDSEYELWRAPLDGGTAEQLAGDMPPIASVLNDDKNLFLNVVSCGPEGGLILKLKKF